MRFLTVVVLMLSVLTCNLLYGGQNISRHLEQDNALEYSIITGGSWRILSNRIDAAMDALVWQDDLNAAQRRELLGMVAWFRLLRDLSGLENAAGIGCSSTELGNGLIHNRLFLSLDPSAPGLVNSFPAAENNLYPAEIIRNLPAGTALAVSMDIRPEALLEALAQSGSLRDRIVSEFPDDFPMQEILQRTAGVWHFILLQDGAMKLDVPDPDGHLFNAAKIFFSPDEGEDEDEDTEITDERISTGFFTIVRGDNRLAIYLGQDEAVFASDVKITLDPAQEAVLGKLPEKCFALVVLLSAKDDVTTGGLPVFTGNVPEIVTFSRENDGMLMTYNGTNTMTGLELFISQFVLDIFEEYSTVPAAESEDEDFDGDSDDADAEDADEEEGADDDIEDKSMTSSGGADDDSDDDSDGDPGEHSGEKNVIDGDSGEDKEDGNSGLIPVVRDRDSDRGRGEGLNRMDSGSERGREMDSGKGKGNGLESGRKDELEDDDSDGDDSGDAPETPCQCESMLNAAKAALAENPDLAAGFYVVRDGRLVAAGDTDNKIAYFGQIESEIPVPLFIAMPHDQRSFCVIFSDGTVMRMRLDKADSFRRIIGFIHTQKMYDERVFQALMEKAAGFDD
ncbi:MAG: hypothetical protein E7053_07895 [Lentisphaerae bacterium]|nr:hypothetical protein [Lentisphaerota bacterium]